MNNARISDRYINAAISGCASFLTLLSIQLWVAGTQDFFKTILGMTLWYLPVVIAAFTVGLLVRSPHHRWGAITGVLTGAAGGISILYIIFSQI